MRRTARRGPSRRGSRRRDPVVLAVEAVGGRRVVEVEPAELPPRRRGHGHQAGDAVRDVGSSPGRLVPSVHATASPSSWSSGPDGDLAPTQGAGIPRVGAGFPFGGCGTSAPLGCSGPDAVLWPPLKGLGLPRGLVLHSAGVRTAAPLRCRSPTRRRRRTTHPLVRRARRTRSEPCGPCAARRSASMAVGRRRSAARCQFAAMAPIVADPS